MAHDAVMVRRRAFLGACSALGLSGTLFPGVLLGMVQEGDRVSVDAIKRAEEVSGLAFSDDQRKLMQRTLNERLAGVERLRAVPLANGVAPALYFDPLPAGAPRPVAGPRAPFRASEVEVSDAFIDTEELAFLSVIELGKHLRSGAVTSVELTEMYLDRLRRFDPDLRCVVTMTEELALEQAAQADAELEAGEDRGPLHGIPWGAKDLLHTRGYRTTYGAKPFENQTIDQDAHVVQKLEEAGAVLVAKLALGALAMGDVWFDGVTKNPWNLEQGSSGSSAGPAAATAAGLAGFTIGTETLGSIVSPCSRCGVTGLRPTYGRVSRAGAMALSWSMDKIGPIARTVEDCAAVFHAIHGADPADLSSVDAPFDWRPAAGLEGLRVGYLASAFEGSGVSDQDRASLEKLESLGLDLKPIELPDFPVWDLTLILNAEAGAAFDELTRSGGVDQLVRQDASAWPNSFRSASLITAVDYLRANRIRSLLIEQMHRTMQDVDVFVSPAFGNPTLALTNLTGHPCVVLPNGFRDDGTPVTITLLGKLYGEAELLQVAKALQDATEFHRKHPARFV
jgi:Asp-tRNA(Asn)/Glu-tRNA(Gln) amidotransferase A subunit family amidase